MKILEKRMTEAIEILDALQSRAFDLRVAGDPAYEWIKHFQASGAFGTNEDNTILTKNIMEVAQRSRRDGTVSSLLKQPLPPSAQYTDSMNASEANNGTDDVDDEGSEALDLIDLEIRG
jgi:hypothetical protein